MATPSWRRWLKLCFAPAPRIAHRKRRPLILEALELRETPASFTWSGATSARWDNPGNWLGGQIPATNGSDSLVFPSSLASGRFAMTNDFPATATFQSIAFNGGGYSIGGSGLIVTNTITSGNAAGLAAKNTIGVPVNMPDAGNIFISVTTSGALLDFAGNLIDNPLPTGPVQVTINGGSAVGTAIFSGNNSGLNAPITVQSGILQATSPTAFGNASNPSLVMTIQAGAQLQVSAPTLSPGVSITAPKLLLNGNGIGNSGALFNVAGSNTWTSPIELDSNVTMGALTGSALTITGQVSDNASSSGFGITKEGIGSLVLNPRNTPGGVGNTFRGQTVVNNGVLAISHSHALGVGNSTLTPGTVPQPTDGFGSPTPGVVVVNSFLDRSGTLRLDFDPAQIGSDPGYNVLNLFGQVVGFTVPDQPLIMSGPGLPGVASLYYQNTIGALFNASGQNVWSRDVALWSDPAAVFAVGFGGVQNTSYGHVVVGVAQAQSLQIDGRIGDNAGGQGYFFDKVSLGTLILPSHNTYNTGPTFTTQVLEGTLTIQDSQALGFSNSTIDVNPLVNSLMPTAVATLELRADNRLDSLNPTTTNLTITKDIRITGTGVIQAGQPVGALFNRIGVNTVLGDLMLGGNFNTGGATIGVASDLDPFGANANAFDDLSQLTVRSQVATGFLHKAGMGELVLDPLTPLMAQGANNQSHTYIDEGWITIRNSLALGSSSSHTYAAPGGALPYGGQFPNGFITNGTWVADGAALVLKENTIGPVTDLTVPDNIVLNGNGLSAANTLVYTELYQSQNNAGALVNLSGNNTITGTVYLNGTAGIGVALDEHATPAVTFSQLNLGPIGEFQAASGIQKWGVKGLKLQGEGMYTGDVDINFGTLTVQHTTALGLGTSAATTTVDSGAALILQGNDPKFAAGSQSGVLIGQNQRLVLNGPGNTSVTGTLIATLTSANAGATAFDNLLRGPITLGSDVNIDVHANSRLLVYGTIDDGAGAAHGINLNAGVPISAVANIVNGGTGGTYAVGDILTVQGGTFSTPAQLIVTAEIGGVVTGVAIFGGGAYSAFPANPVSVTGGGGSGAQFDLVTGAGELALAASNTYRGATTINQGVVTVLNGQGLGASVAPVNVNTSATLQFQGNITVANPLNIIGSGPGTLPSVPVTWFPQGPAPITGATHTPNGSDPVGGRISSVAADPHDPNLLYLTSSGGGAWRSRNAGKSWQPLVDTTTQIQVQTDIGVFQPMVAGQLALFTGTISVAPAGVNGVANIRDVVPDHSTPDFIYIGLGEPANSPDSFGGAGVLKTADGGLTWTLLQGPNGEFVGKTISQIAIDPADRNIIYIAVAQARGNVTAITNGTGIWKYDPSKSLWFDPSDPLNSVWVNMTQTLIPTPRPSGSRRLIANGGPGTAGPEENLNISFTDTDDYTAIIVYDDPNNAFVHTQWGLPSPNNKIMFMAVGTENPVEQGPPNSGFFANAVYISIDSGVTWRLYGFPLTDALGNPAIQNPHNGRISLAVNYTLPAASLRLDNLDPQGTFTVYALSAYSGTYDSSGNRFGATLQPITALRDTFREISRITLTWDTSTNPVNTIQNYQIPLFGGPFGARLGWAPGGNFASPGTWGTVAAAGINNDLMGAPGGAQSAFSSRGQFAQAIAVDPANANRVFVGGIGEFEPQGIASSGIYQSTDGGATFASAVVNGVSGPHSDAHAMAFDAGSLNLLLGTSGGIWELAGPASGGVGWTSLNTSYLQTTQFNSILVGASDPFQIYGATKANGFVIYNGTTWVQTDVGNSNFILQDSQNPDILYHVTDLRSLAAGNPPLGVRKSTDGGQTWTTVLDNFSSDMTPPAISPYNDPFANANPGFFFFGAPTGTTGYGSLGLHNHFAPAAIDPQDPERLVVYRHATTIGGSIWESLDGGATWSDLDATNQIGTFGGAWNWNEYFATSIGLAKFQGPVAPYAPAPFVPDPRFPAVTDKGANSLVPNTIYVTSAFGVYLTKDRGNTWVQLNNGGPNSLPVAENGGFGGFGFSDVHFEEVVVDPNNSNVAYVAISQVADVLVDPTHQGHIYRTADAGQTWADISGNLPAGLPVWTVEIDPRNANVYIGTDNGVWMLPGGNGSTWQKVGSGLPDVQVRDLALNTSVNTLSAATYGRGVYTIWLDNPLPVTVPASVQGVLRAISGSPNLIGSINLVGDVTIRTDENAQLSLLGNISGPGQAMTKVGPGTLVLGGSNNYGGATTTISYTPAGGSAMFIDTAVKEGTLTVRSAQALGSAASGTLIDTLGPGATTPPVLELQSSMLTAEEVVLNGDGGSFNNHRTGSLRNSSNTNVFAGTIILNSSSTIGVDSGSMLTITGTIKDNSQNFALRKDLPGTLVFGGSNAFTYTGNTLIDQGILRIENPNSVGATGGIIQADGAQVQVAAPTGNPGISVLATGPLVLAGSGIFGSGALVNLAGDNVWQGPITLDDTPGIFPVTNPGSTASIGVSAGTSLTIDGAIGEDSPSFNLRKVGTGRLILKQDGSYSGSTTVAAGVLNIQANSALGVAGNPPGAGANVTVASGAALELEGNITTSASHALFVSGQGFGGAGVLRSNAGSNTWSGSVTLQTSATLNAAAGSELIVGGSIVDPTPAPATAPTLTVNAGTDTGTVVFSAAGTYQGTTTVRNGVLRVTHASALGGTTAGTTVQSGATLQVQGSITVAGEALTISGAGNGGAGALLGSGPGSPVNTWQGPITLAGNSSIGVSSGRLVLDQAIGDGGQGFGVTKVGAATLDLAGAASNTYTGTTLVSDGILRLNKSGAGVVPFGGPLTVGGSITLAEARWVASNQLPANTTVTVNNNGLLSLRDQDETIGTLNVNNTGNVQTGTGGAGVLTVNNLAMTGGVITLDIPGSQLILTGNVTATSAASGPATITSSGNTVATGGSVSLGGSNRTFTVDTPVPATGQSADMVISAPIVGSGSEELIKAGSGILRLTGTSTYTGNTSVQGGNLQVDGLIANVRLDGGTLSGSGTVGTINANTGGVVNPAIDPPGLTANGTVTFNPQTQFQVDLSNNGLTTIGNLLTVTGNVNLGDAILTGTFNNVQNNDTFTILRTTGGTISGTFDTGAGSFFFVSGRKFLIDYVPAVNPTSVVLTALRNDSTVTITPSSSAPLYGETVNFLVVVTPEAGAMPIPDGTQVAITFDGVSQAPLSLVGGQATFTPAGTLSLGNHTIEATFLGNSDFNQSPASGPPVSATVNVSPASTQLSLTSPGTTVFNEGFTVTATVTPVSPGGGVPNSGTVTFTLDGNTITPAANVAGGQATLTLPALNGLAVGPHSITAIYSGSTDGAYLASATSAPLQHTIAKAATDVTIAPPSPARFGQLITFNASVAVVSPGAGTPTGTVTFKDNGNPLGTVPLDINGNVILTTSSGLSLGNHNITAEYSGDGNFLVDVSPAVIQSVIAADTSVSLLLSTSPTVAGESFTVTATVSAVAPGAGTPAGSVTFFVNGTPLVPSMNLVSGQASYTIGGLPQGTHNISANYAGTPPFNASSGNVSHNVNAASTMTTISATAPTVFGQLASFTATVTPVAPGGGIPTGTVTFSVDGSPATPVSLNGAGQAIFSTAALAVGNRTITAEYNGSTSYLNSTTVTPVVHQVNPANTTVAISASTNPAVAGQPITVTATVAAVAPGAGTPTGTVVFFVDGNAQAPLALGPGASVSLNIGGLPVGNHSVTANYNGDTNFVLSASSSFTVVVNQATTSTTLLSSVNPALAGQQVDLTATVAVVAPGAGTPTGFIAFDIDGVTQAPVPLVGGTATLSLTSLSVGGHAIRATYSGDADFLVSASTILSQSINPASTTTVLNSSSNPSVWGENVTFTATVNPVAPAGGTPTGFIRFTVDGAQQTPIALSGGSASLSISTFAVGSHTVSAAYLGSPSYVSSASGTVSQTVDQSGSTLSLVSSTGATSVWGQDVTITANVTATAPGAGTPTGNLTFTVDGVPQTPVSLASGSASITLTGLALGGHTIDASYAGNTNFLPATASHAQQVNQAASTTAIVATVNPSRFGQGVSVTATVTATAPGAGSPTGSVTFVIDGNPQAPVGLSGDSASLNLPVLAAGTHTIDANYSGDTFFLPSTIALSQQVNQALTTTTFVSSSANPLVGESFTLTATVAVVAPGAGSPTGTVVFAIDGVNRPGAAVNGSGQAAITVNDIGAGVHTITATYTGDANFATSTSASANQQVNQAATTTSMVANPEPSLYGEPTVFTVTVAAVAPGAGTPTGTVTFTTATGSATRTLSGGVATLSISALPAGVNPVSASYSGDANFLASAMPAPLNHQVNQASTTTTVVSNPNPTVFGQLASFTVTVAPVAPGGGIPTGTVVFTVDGFVQPAMTLSAGQATLTTATLATGNHDISATYAGDSNFINSASGPLVHQVNQAATQTTLASSANPSVFGQGITVTATITPVAPGSGPVSGTVTFTVDGNAVLPAVNVVNGQASLPLPNLGVGSHNITAAYSGDTSFQASATVAALVQQVNQSATTTSVTVAPAPSVYGQQVTYTATVAAVAPGAGVPTGSVIFTIDGIAQTPVAVTGGQATFTTTTLNTGTHIVSAAYSGDGNFFASSTSSDLSHQVTTSGSTIAVVGNPTPSLHGQSVTFTATVSPAPPGGGVPTGQVIFAIDGVNQAPVPLSGGQATLSVSNLGAGNHAITASYAGDSNFLGSSTTSAWSQQVDMASTTTALASAPVPSTFGQSVTFTATVSPIAPGGGVPTGSVSFFVDGVLQTAAPLSGGQATFTTTALAAGNRSIQAQYTGDVNFSFSVASPFSHQVNQSATTTGLTVSPTPSLFGQPVDFVATVSPGAPGGGVPTGSVAFTVNGSPHSTIALVGGQATLTIADLAVSGPIHTVSASYQGSANHQASVSSAVTHQVNQASTTTALTSSANPSGFGAAATITATVSPVAPAGGIPTGSVIFTLDGSDQPAVTLTGGQATFTLPAGLVRGPHQVAARYLGSTSHDISAGSMTQQVINSATSVTLTPTPAASVFGQPITVTATVASVPGGLGTPTGGLVFNIDGVDQPVVALVNGSATFSSSTLAVGSRTITATYSGDADFQGSTGTLNYTVSQAGTTLTLASSANPSPFASSLTFTATVAASSPSTATPAGQVVFTIDGVSQAPVNLDAQGQATLTTSSLSKGPHTIEASYATTSSFGASSAALTQQISNAATSTTLTNTPNPSTYGQTVSLTAVVSPVVAGVGTPTGSVTFVIDGAPTTMTLTGGQVTLNLNTLSAGTHTVSVSYAGDTDFLPSAAAQVSQQVNPSVTTTAVTSAPAPSVYGQLVTFTATVAPVTPGSGVPTGSVTFNIGGVTTTVALVSGQATHSVPTLAVATHPVSVSYAGDGNFQASTSAPRTHTVNSADTTTTLSGVPAPSTFGQAVTFTATVNKVVPSSGTPSGNMIFAIDGVDQPAQPLSGGRATLTLSSLDAGTRSITARYQGDGNFNPSQTASPLAHQVNPATTSINVAADIAPSLYGQAVTFTATMSVAAPGAGTPAGSVIFTINGVDQPAVALSGGQATLTLSNLVAARHAVRARYTATQNFRASSTAQALLHQVDPAATTTTLTATSASSAAGQGVTFTATVAAVGPASGTPTGTITFVVDGTPRTPVALTGGQATLALTSLGVGPHTVSASYSPGNNTNFIASAAGQVSHDVTQAGTTTTLAASAAPSVSGQAVTFTATVAPVAPGAGTPTGSVSFSVNGTPRGTIALIGGTATITIADLAVSTHNISASYAGDASFQASAATPLSHQVDQASSNVALTSSAQTADFGEAVTVTATVSAVAPGGGVPTGNVIFLVNGASPTTIALAGGKATFSLPALPIGSHTVTATYQGNANFRISTPTTINQVVRQARTSVAVTSSAPSSVSGQAVTFTATVSPVAPGTGTPTGSIIFSIDGAAQPARTLSNGSATLTLLSLTPGSHNITAAYTGDTNFLTSATGQSFTQQVGKASTATSVSAAPASSVFGQAVAFTATVSVSVPGGGTPTGTVTFTVDSTSQTTVALSGGQATLNLAALPVGAHAIAVSYNGDTRYNASSTGTPLSFQVNEAATTTVVTAASASSVAGQLVTFTATVTANAPGAGAPDGSVTFIIDGADGPVVNLNAAGSASLPLSSLAVGSHAIAARYSGSSSFLGGTSAAVSHQVARAASGVALQSSLAISTSGQAVTLTATVSAVAPGAGTPTGAVTFLADGQPLSTVNLDAQGRAILNVSSLAAGTHTLTATYAGDASFQPGATSAGLGLQVNQADTTTTIASAPAGPVTRQSITFTATVQAAAPGGGTPTGQVTFIIDNVARPAVQLDGTGRASISVDTLTAGNHIVTASFDGDSSYRASTSTAFTQLVKKAGATVAVAASAAPSAFGQSVDFTVTVGAAAPGAGTPTGQVTFIIDGSSVKTADLVNGQAVLSLGTLPAGSHTIRASYAGDNHYLAGSTAQPLTHQVNPAATTTTLTSDATPSAVGQPVTITATVSAAGGNTPTGSVVFTVDGTAQAPAALVAGTASITLTGLGLGSHAITASYSGAANFQLSNSGPLSQQVNQAGTAVALSSSAATAAFGQPITFTALVNALPPGAGTPTGAVVFAINGVTRATVPLAGGQATLTVDDLPTGDHSVTASYAGDTNFGAAATPAQLTQQIGQAATTAAISSSAQPASFGNDVVLTVTIAPVAPGAGTPVGQVIFTVDNVARAPITLVNGRASITLTQPSRGDHPVTVAYNGSANFQNSSAAFNQTIDNADSAVTIAADPTAAVFGQSVVFTATVVSVPGGLGTPTGQVTFTVDGIAQAPAGLDASGRATLNLGSLSVGTHSVTASYSGDAGFDGSSAAGPLSIDITQAQTTTSVASSAASVTFGSSVTISATVAPVAPGAGTPTGTVIFSVGGTAQAPVTLVGGVATLVLNSLPVASHSITASYAGDQSFSASATAAPLTQTVTRAATTLALGSAANPSIFNTPVTVTATVGSPALGVAIPGGQVVFSIDNVVQPAVPVAGGQASISLGVLSSGTHSITASYSGDASFLPSNAQALSQQVDPVGTTTELRSADATSEFGQSVTFTATVASSGAGVPIGQVVFTVDNVAQPGVALDAAGKATFTTSALLVGSRTVQANFIATANFQSSSAAMTQQVNKAATALTLTSTAAATVLGTPVTFTATVNVTAGAGAPTGQVIFTIDGVAQAPVNLDSAGKASITVSALSTGSHTVLAAYSGSPDFEGSTAALPHRVDPTPTTIALNTPAVSGQNVTLTANVSSTTPGMPSPTGVVTFFIDGRPVGTANVVNGSATFTAGNLAAGSHTFSAVYGGSGSAAGTSSSAVPRVAVIAAQTPVTPTTPTTRIAALQARVTRLLQRGSRRIATLRITALTSSRARAIVSGAVAVRIVRGPRGGRVIVPRGGIRLRSGVVVTSLNFTRTGTYTLRFTIGRISTQVRVSFSSRVQS